MSIYGKPVWQLLIDFANETLDLDGSTFTPQDATRWFTQKYPEIKKGTINAQIRMMSTNVKSRLHWSPSEHHNMFFYLGSGTYRRYRSEQDPPPIMSKDDVSYDQIESEIGQVVSGEGDIQREITGGAEFAFERDLQNYLVKNLESVEPGLKLYNQDGINGIEFPVGGRRIDILAVDAENNLVVLELKVSKGHDRVIGQILRYIGWIKENLAEDGQNVRGIIIAKDITSDLKWACSATQGISLREYSITFSLDEVN